MSDTIAAISTAAVKSAIGIIRLSGSSAIDIVSHVFFPANGNSMTDAPDRKLIYGNLKNKNGDVIDVCLCTVSRGPHSYTGEDTAEIQCHGSPAVLSEGLSALFSFGARQALAGEFTKRGFLNGRMDLVQSEAVIDLISAETSLSARNAAGQLGGAISEKIDKIYDSLLNVTSHFHAVIDYPDEDIDPFEEASALQVLEDSAAALKKLAESFERGRFISSGIPSAIIGTPNSGKSSLLNALLGYERAIVTPIAGTTRDTIEVRVTFGDTLLDLSDTAGLRKTDDPVEKLGIDRALSTSGNSHLVLAVFDSSRGFSDADKDVIFEAKKAPVSIAVINKSDLEERMDTSEIENNFKYICKISALSGLGLKNLENTVTGIFAGEDSQSCGSIITNARQFDAVSRALAALASAVNALKSGVTADAVLIDTETAMSAIGELGGKTVRDDIVSRIFERFCVGK